MVSVAVILASSEIGRRLGVRVTGRGGKNISTLESAILALLALMIGFTFAMALSRFEGRREAVMHEANAIGTTALRARLLPPPHRGEALKLLQEYVKIRIDITERPLSLETMNAAIARSNEIHEALRQWQLAKKDTGMNPPGVHPDTQRDRSTTTGARLTAARNRVPNIVLDRLLRHCRCRQSPLLVMPADRGAALRATVHRLQRRNTALRRHPAHPGP